MIYFVVDGIESNLAGIVTVQAVQKNYAEKQLSLMDYYLVILTCFLTLITNTPYHSLKWVYWGFASCVVTLIYSWVF